MNLVLLLEICDEIVVRLIIPGPSNRGQWDPMVGMGYVLILITVGRVPPRGSVGMLADGVLLGGNWGDDSLGTCQHGDQHSGCPASTPNLAWPQRLCSDWQVGPDVNHHKKFKGLFQRLVHHQEEVSHIRSNAGSPVYQQRKIIQKVTFTECDLSTTVTPATQDWYRKLPGCCEKHSRSAQLPHSKTMVPHWAKNHMFTYGDNTPLTSINTRTMEINR